jgi:hypothetical protein
MAVATYTATTYNQTPRLRHTGINLLIGSLARSGNTLSDIIFLGKIPNKATIIDYYVKGTTAAAGGLAYKLGITGGGGGEATFGTGSLSATATVVFRSLQGCPFKVSRSDTDAQDGATVYMTCSVGSWSESISIDFCFMYVADGNAI